jgi:3-oxoacyl-[acyl-carrier protein] reductase
VNVDTDAARAFAGQDGCGLRKAALEALTRGAAIEPGTEAITVNAVAPNPVQTGCITSELKRLLLPEIPLRRLGSPEDVADDVVVLESAQARWIIGAVVPVPGEDTL